MKIFHSTVHCPECGYDSGWTIFELISFLKDSFLIICQHCGSKIIE